jgi:hypothetical protein
MKTFRIPKTSLDKWLKALRSGDYKQGRDLLRTGEEGNYAYCCLGVLQQCLDGKVEMTSVASSLPELGGVSAGIPSIEWAKEHGIEQISVGKIIRHPSTDFNPILQKDIDGFTRTASFCNDNARLTFKEIADLIEEVAEAY